MTVGKACRVEETTFQQHWESRKDISIELNALLQDAQDNQEAERIAATDIQRLFRGQWSRTVLMSKRRAEIAISRVFRGHRDRKECELKKSQHISRIRMAIYHYHAIRVQSLYRGYYSRRNKHDFRARKAYINAIQSKGSELRSLLSNRLSQQESDERQTVESSMKEDYKSLSSNLHHLVGTATTPGVYGAPFAPLKPPTAFGEAVEESIKRETLEVIRSKKYRKQKKNAVRPAKIRGSIQANESYAAEEEAENQRRRYDRMRRVGSSDFDTSCKTRAADPPFLGSNNVGIKFVDSYRNPYFLRGVPRKGEIDFDPETTRLGKAPEIPFYTSGGQEKHKVLPNDLFDK